ncbi:MAG: 50S ribosomal protein L21 [Candidatus Aminicenantes bacterium]|nr:50S ribosomal protein L21 [Candidatus Aminicenantes bacterium]
MFVVIKTGGKQYRAKEGDVLEIEKLQVGQGKKVTFDEILLVEDNGKVMIGQPHVADAAVTAVVLENFKDDKIIVFKKKRRKQYKRKTGHRQQLTRIKIEKILTGKEAAEAKKAVEKKEPAVKKETVEKKAVEKAPAAKAAPAKKAAPKPKPKAAPKPKPKAAAKPAAKTTKKASEVKE